MLTLTAKQRFYLRLKNRKHIKEQEKDLEYWHKNAEEDCNQVPISVLRYIAELEIIVPQVNKNDRQRRKPNRKGS